MKHNRASHRIGIALLVALGLATALILTDRDAAMSQEPTTPAPAIPDVFYPKEVPALPPVKYMPGAIFTIGTALPKQVHETCLGKDTLPPGTIIFACTAMQTDAVLMPNPCLYWWETYAALFCHEQGHVNGWPADHPDE